MNPLIDNDILIAIIGVLGCAGSIGVTITHWLLTRYDKRHPTIDTADLANKLDNLNTVVVELAWLRLSDMHAKAMEAGWMHQNEKRIAERIYANYHALGGNGTGTAMIEDIRKLPTSPPHDDGRHTHEGKETT